MEQWQSATVIAKSGGTVEQWHSFTVLVKCGGTVSHCLSDSKEWWHSVTLRALYSPRFHISKILRADVSKK